MAFIIPHGISYDLGSPNNRKHFKLQLPLQKNVGILISGGLDSAILYWLLMYLNNSTGASHIIQPYTIHRTEGSPHFAPKVIDYVTQYWKTSAKTVVVGDNTLPQPLQVESGVRQILKNKLSQVVFLGNIKMYPQHAIGWSIPIIRDTAVSRSPMLELDKSHIVDLILQTGQSELFNITHSCVAASGRCKTCNGCRERSWGFEQLGISDPGVD